MKTKTLFPYHYKKIGWWLLALTIIFILLTTFVFDETSFLNVKVFALVDRGIMFDSKDVVLGLTKNIISDEIQGVLVIISLLFIAFSKQKQEDEFIAKTRLESLVWAVYVNYGVLLLAILFVYGFDFFWIMVFNMFTILVFFIIRFNWVLYLSNKNLSHAK